MAPKQRKIIWSERATKEYLATLDYILQEWGEKTAEKFESTIFRKVDRISHNPSQFPLINSAKGVRKCVATYQNSIFFWEQNHRIEILSVFDNRQDPGNLKL